MFYFGITTMTTVGFGDFNPKSNLERAFTALWMLFGVACFSSIFGNFQDIMIEMTLLDDYNQDDELHWFLGILKTFNKNENLDQRFKRKIEKYFFYRWKMERNGLI